MATTDTSNDLVADFFGTEIGDVPDEVKRQFLINEIKKDIDLLRQIDVRAMNRCNDLCGPLATGALVISGRFDIFDRAADVLYEQISQVKEFDF